MLIAALCRRFAGCVIAAVFATTAAAFDCPELRAGTGSVDPGGFPTGLLWRVEAETGVTG